MIIEERERYINPYTDFGFKKLFGSELNKKEYWDYYSTMETAHKKGRAEGHLEDARRMKADNMPTEQIAKYTGLSIDEITEL